MDNLQVNYALCGIYGLRCKTANKWYVGQSIDILSRWFGV